MVAMRSAVSAFLLLLVQFHIHALTLQPLLVYQPCQMPDGVVGACRTSLSQQAAPLGQAGAQAPLELPIDMRLPCAGAANTTCAENVDVAEQPVRPPSSSEQACSVTLMPWSPFPCSFNSTTYKGIEGQEDTDWCYSSSTKPQQHDYQNARELWTDGYQNLFLGVLPDKPCGVVGGPADIHSSSSSSTSSSKSSSGSSSQSPARGLPSYGRHFSRVLLTLNFRVAAGRQFDRTYSFQIGRAVAALGTCTEPTRWLGTDKWWSTTVDITHLQAYLAPGLPTRMKLNNLLSNVYNVPLWAEAKVTYYWEQQQQHEQLQEQQQQHERQHGQQQPEQQQQEKHQHEQQQQQPAHSQHQEGAPATQPLHTVIGVVADGSRQVGPAPTQAAAAAAAAQAAAAAAPAAAREGKGAAPAPAAADVPDEVLPLVPETAAAAAGGAAAGEGDEESLAWLVGSGDSPSAWPRATFQLPADLSQPGNIVRAQLLVTPKADACEEFWAMNPSGAGSNNTCGGVSTGEPYREVRVYLNGQLAGFSPIYYTMYTGGVDPRMWSAIVASYTYSLPTYTFDLSPWLPQLNAHPQPSRVDRRSNKAPGTLVRPASAVGSGSDTDVSADAGVGAADAVAIDSNSDVRLPVVLQQQQQQEQVAPSRRLAQAEVQATAPGDSKAAAVHAHQQQGQRDTEESVTDDSPAAHTITVELAGATSNGWVLANTLLLWRAVGPEGQPLQVTGDITPQVTTSAGFEDPLSSQCSPVGDQEVSVAGKCRLQLRNRFLHASAALQVDGQHELTASCSYTTARYDSVITYSNDVNATDGSLTWRQETQHQASWSVARQQRAQEPWQPRAAAAGGAAGDAAAAITAAAPAADAVDDDDAVEHGRHVFTQSSVAYDWLNAGVVAAGGVLEFSFNATLLQPTVYAAAQSALWQPNAQASRPSSSGSGSGSSDAGSEGGSSGQQGTVHAPATAAAAVRVTGSQQHYQRAVMLNVYNPKAPKCVVPKHPTHTVQLSNSISSSHGERRDRGVAAVAAAGHEIDGGSRVARRRAGSCVQRWGTCGFCGASLMENEVDWDAQDCEL